MPTLPPCFAHPTRHLPPAAPSRRRPRAGFTIIELLLVMVVIGILASMAGLRVRETRGRAEDAKLRSDLRNLMTAQESYFTTYGSYTTDLAALRFSPSPNVVLAVSGVSVGGWAATTASPSARLDHCAVFTGTATAPEPATIDGQITCR